MRRLALALLVAATGCGDDDGGTNRDAGPGDDAEVDASPTTPVTLTVKVGGAAVAGVRVHFQNPDSSVITSVDTDATGVASAMMPEGGFVTAVNPFAPAPGVGTTDYLYTYGGVQPGDDLRVEDPGDFTSAGTLSITAAMDNDASVVGYRFISPCDTSDTQLNPSYSMPLQENCKPATDIIVASVNNADEIVHWVYVPNVNTSGASADLTANALANTPTSKTYTYNNLIGYYQSTAALELWSSAGRMVANSFGDIQVTSLSNTYLLPGFANAVEVASIDDEAEFSYHSIYNWSAFAGTDHTVDTATRRLRNATSGTSFAASTKRVTWTEETTGAVPDFGNGNMEIARNTGSHYIYWDIVAPYTAGQVQYPTLPVEATDYNPGSGDVVDVTVTTGKVPNGYNTIRENFFAIDGPSDFASTAASGQLELQDIVPGGGLLQRMRTLAAPVHPRTGLAAKQRR